MLELGHGAATQAVSASLPNLPSVHGRQKVAADAEQPDRFTCLACQTVVDLFPSNVRIAIDVCQRGASPLRLSRQSVSTQTGPTGPSEKEKQRGFRQTHRDLRRAIICA